MRPTKFIPIMVLIAMLSFSCSSEDFPSETIDSMSLPVPPAAKNIEIEILELINAHRINVGLEALNNHETIKAVAYTHTGYMVEVNNVSHDNFYQRKNSLMDNTNASKVSENVAYAYSSAQSVVNAWLNSEGHKHNIEGDYTDFDISAEQNAEGKWYFTNIFIKR
ncbi:CAP domain-containing protein [Psychroserpens burtonensis]|uniref:CAP domain-containing protein n=1 Tax=Psychroserpens burtonensis TaxID=49278 RepID=A0A5C7BCL9_9FLAO|nr:CAP domain-containing protein [Psychroserpens burtonensis]TXE19565.1 CAP domain-containing protein [Psychroserpens burtonensis]